LDPGGVSFTPGTQLVASASPITIRTPYARPDFAFMVLSPDCRDCRPRTFCMIRASAWRLN